MIVRSPMDVKEKARQVAIDFFARQGKTEETQIKTKNRRNLYA